MDFMKSLGALALGSRLRRLSDRLMRDVAAIYQTEGVPFEPRWFPLFRLLADRGDCSVGEAAEALGATQPSVSQTARAMQKAGLLVAAKDPMDQRRSVLALTNSAAAMVPRLRPLWRRLLRALGGVADAAGTELLRDLARFEAALDQADLARRTAAEDRELPAARVVGYQPAYRAAFERLNREWLERYFAVEPVDEQYFADPEGKILAVGGRILFATVGDAVVGTCALLPDGAGDFELGKMAVTEGYQGLGLGETLLKAALKEARGLGATSVHLVTNSALKPAIALYRKLGFEVTHEGPHPKYSRGDLCMTHRLSRARRRRAAAPSSRP